MRLKLFTFIIFISGINLFATIDIETIPLESIKTDSEEFRLWLALFGLGVVALISLFLSSEQLSNFKKRAKKREENQNKVNHAQDQLLSNMSENIQNIAQETIQTAQQLVGNSQDKSINDNLSRVVKSENQLLNITTNLIEFLRIKSKKITIVNEKLKLSNLFNDVSGILKTNTKEIELELIYDIKSSVPNTIKGDTLNLSKIFVNIFLYSVNNGAKKLKLEVSKNAIFHRENIYFKISSDIKMDVENSENIFHSNYDEDSSNYNNLGLFISKELSTLMGGELIARNDKEDNLEFLLDIPFVELKESQKVASSIAHKNILLVDSSNESALLIKEMLKELHHSVTLESKDNYLKAPMDFRAYDIVILDRELYEEKTLAKLKKHNAKSISMDNLFTHTHSDTRVIADIEIHKPFIKEHLSETIEKLFTKKPSKTTDNSELIVHRKTFEDSLNIDLYRFVEFRETKVLLVEDNIINQKVFVGVLGKSGMSITIANDGQEALEQLKTKEFNIIFMDINMPIMDGYTATKLIREDSRYNQLPIVALSALTSVPEVDKMFNCGMNGYLSKPLLKEKLFTVFNIFIEKKSEDRRKNPRAKRSRVTLDGLDVALGMSKSNSSEIFYKEILLEFRDAYGKSDKIFEKLVTDFRFEQLKMLSIDVKGLSDSIGAYDMHKLTIEIIQKLIYKKFDVIPEYVNQYKNELHKINKAIDRYLKA